ncbi:MAG TPA: SCO family protein [Polyangiaceae bacterium]|nr:SCO family protein [Polyangiaceae bacterium]
MLPTRLSRRAVAAALAFAPLAAALAGCQRHQASAAEALPPLGTVQPFWLTDQDGRTFTEASLDGKVWVAAFMFTRCPTVCPEMVRRMRGIQEQAKQRGVALALVSFSVDPENDTPEVLRAYTAAQQLDTSNWRFLTGDSAVIRDTAEKGFKIGVDGTPRAGSEHFGITHGTHLVLLDTHRTIRGYYQSTDSARVAALLDDAARLANE